MTKLDQIISLTKTGRLILAALVLSIAVSALISGEHNPYKSIIYSSLVQSVDALSSRLVGINGVSSTASEILPRSEVESKSYLPTLPDFSTMKNIRTKKQEFFTYMLPKVRRANDRILSNRRLLLMIRDDLRTGDTLDEDDIQFVGALKAHYRIQQQTDLRTIIDDLLIRVDVVPESLVLAQAANESGWGTSRFTRQANNLFGVWCFSEGCGLTPKNRDEGLHHQVTKYNSVQDSIKAYMHTLNTHAAYIQLRDIRAAKRSEEQHFIGLALAEGLLRYSSRGVDYVREIQQLIRVNDLQKYTLPLQA
ncbi:MAG: glucosaminidase domain-containing protein [Candidatus Azotimanducaceae bacterium WSBS_2022_MAG_OTU7]